jgi:hypoxanthine-DNA glycosylase
MQPFLIVAAASFNNITMLKFALPPLVTPSSEILILGTMPGDQSIARQQYYGNRGNRFWTIMFMIFEKDFSDSYEDRKELLARHKIALWNVFASCEREGSGDLKISNAVVNDFTGFHLRYPNIAHIFFESKSAAKFYYKNVEIQPAIAYHTLPSTSGLNARISFAQKLVEWKAVAETALAL